MLSTADLLGMQTTLNASLPDVAKILHRSVTADGAGGQAQTYPAPTDVGVPSVPCRLSILSDAERHTEDVVAEHMGAATMWYATLPWDAPVSLTDRLAIYLHDVTGALTLRGLFEVNLVTGPTTWGIALRCLCREIL
jgi:hypothetical protein